MMRRVNNEGAKEEIKSACFGVGCTKVLEGSYTL